MAELNYGTGTVRTRTERTTPELLTEAAVRAHARTRQRQTSPQSASTSSSVRNALPGTSPRVSLPPESAAAVSPPFIDEVTEAVASAASTDDPEQGATGSTTSPLRAAFEAPTDPDAPDVLPSIGSVGPAVPVLPSEPTTTVVESSPLPGLPGPLPANTEIAVRRPMLGLVGYEDRFCRLEVFAKSGDGGSGDYIPMFNSTYSSGRHPVNTNFLLNQVSFTPAETAQIVQTMGDYFVSDVGEAPATLSVQGVLFESKNFPWLSEWRANYEQFLRARQCILRRAMVYLTIDDTVYSGYLLNPTMSRNVSPAWEIIPFSFSLIVRSAVNLREQNLFPSDTSTPQQVEGVRAGNIGDPDASTLAQVAEIISGGFDEGAQLNFVDKLVFEGSVSDAVLRVNIDHLVSVAQKINRASIGTKGEFIDLQNLRNGYLSQRLEELQSIGITNPETLQKLGFPSRYELAVSARGARVQEEYRNAIERGVNAARRGVSSWVSR